jgi:hypothetical protein
MARTWTRARLALYATVSVFALAAASPKVRGADLPVKAPPALIPAAVVRDEWNVWVEGGAFWTRGANNSDPVNVGRDPPGGEGAAGFDYLIGGTPYHLSGQFRYGVASTSGTFARNGAVSVPTVCTSPPCAASVAQVPASGTFTNRETHWLLDFAAGREVGLGGLGPTQLKAGLRIADISDKVSGGANFVAPSAFCSFFAHSFGSCAPVGFIGAAPGAFSFEENSKFFGVGPRVGLDGTVPLGGHFAIEYLGGVAELFGRRSLNLATGGSAATFGILPLSVSGNAAVFNLDAQAGITYFFTPDLKITASYRFDGYWDALKTINTAGTIVNADRFFYGPMLRLTVINR